MTSGGVIGLAVSHLVSVSERHVKEGECLVASPIKPGRQGVAGVLVPSSSCGVETIDHIAATPAETYSFKLLSRVI